MRQEGVEAGLRVLSRRAHRLATHVETVCLHVVFRKRCFIDQSSLELKVICFELFWKAMIWNHGLVIRFTVVQLETELYSRGR